MFGTKLPATNEHVYPTCRQTPFTTDPHNAYNDVNDIPQTYQCRAELKRYSACSLLLKKERQFSNATKHAQYKLCWCPVFQIKQADTVSSGYLSWTLELGVLDQGRSVRLSPPTMWLPQWLPRWLQQWLQARSVHFIRDFLTLGTSTTDYDRSSSKNSAVECKNCWLPKRRSCWSLKSAGAAP